MLPRAFIRPRQQNADSESVSWGEYVFGFGLGIVAVVAGLIWLGFQRDLMQNGQRVEGTIIDYTQRADDHLEDPFERAYYPVFRYQDKAGRQYTLTSSVGFMRGYFHAPVKAAVIYDLRNPEEAQLASAHYFWQLLLLITLGELGLIVHGLRTLWQQFNPAAICSTSSRQSEPLPPE